MLLIRNLSAMSRLCRLKWPVGPHSGVRTGRAGDGVTGTCQLGFAVAGGNGAYSTTAVWMMRHMPASRLAL